LWGFNTGSTSSDYAENVHADAAGNVYSAGQFEGTVDFDPGAGTLLRSSNGSNDGFMVKYDASGQPLLCITLGGSGRDKINNVRTDAAGNIYLAGYFRGSNVDFDPGPGTFFLSSNGDAGSEFGFGGDISCKIFIHRCISLGLQDRRHAKRSRVRDSC
jgi:hypothetical protein